MNDQTTNHAPQEWAAVLAAYVIVQEVHASIVYGVGDDDAGMYSASDDDLFAWCNDLESRLYGTSPEMDAMHDAVGEYCHARRLTDDDARSYGPQA